MNAPGKAPCDEGVIQGAAPDTTACADSAKPWVLAATILGSSMAFIDGSVISVALPAIQGDFAAAISDAQWIVNAYTLMLGALILIGGAAGDRFGRRRVFVIGVVIFTAASVLCGLAPTALTLIAARVLQGIGGALLIPGSLAIISAAFPKAERGRAIGTWAGVSALTTALGPVLGGWLVDMWSWRAIFFINVPLAALVIAITLRHVPESRSGRIEPIDWLGGALATLGLGALAYGLTAGPEAGWAQPSVVGALVLGIFVLGAFLAAERRARAPIMPLGLFRSATFSGANALTFLLYFSLSGVFFFLPFNLIQMQGYSATEAGAALLPFIVIMGVLSRWSGGLTARYGVRGPLIIGPVIAAAGFALIAVPGIGQSYWTTFFPAMIVLGLGMTVTVAPLTTAVMGALEEHYAGTASGINNAVSRIAGLLAIAVLGAIAVGAFGAALDARLAERQTAPEIRAALHAEVPKLAEAKPPERVTGAERAALEQALSDSVLWSFRLVMLISAGLALLSGVCAALTIRPDIKPASS
jgi:EmrB/QacA subfamily drug resistance transporter